MARIFRDSFLDPLRKPGSAVTLGLLLLVCWLLVSLMVNQLDRVEDVEWALGQLVQTLTAILFVPALVLALPIISAEAHDRTLMLQLLQPIERAAYYTARVAGRALFSALYFGTAIAGVRLAVALALQESLNSPRSPLPPDIAWTLVMVGLSLVTMTASIGALAPLSSSRFGHAFYWLGLWIALWQARAIDESGAGGPLTHAGAWLVREIVGPFLVGPHREFVASASLSPWYLARALLQWGFGLALAYVVGVFAFSRMEVGRRA